MGVSMLPRLAAAVWSTATGTARCSCPAIRSTVSPKGTKVISDTSLVMAMLEKKGSATSASATDRVEAHRRSSRLPSQRNSPSCWNPFITAIRLNSWARVSQSRYPR